MAQRFIWLVGAVVTLVAIGMFVAVHRKSDSPVPLGEPAEPQGIFTFLEVGAASRLNDDLENRLAPHLGTPARATRATLSLDTNLPGLLAAHLPRIWRLHTRLNTPAGERVEHDITRLTYNYAPQHGTPFTRVELVFDGTSRAPLFFRIRIARDAPAVHPALEDKYGPAHRMDWPKDPQAVIRLWRDKDDALLLIRTTDRIGAPDRRLYYYFGRHLAELLDREAAREDSPDDSVPVVF